MYLIVGLGNIGTEYENTRHNIGFYYLNNYINSHNMTFNKKKFDGLYTESTINGDKIIYLKPGLYMNLSGIVVRKYVDYFKIPIENILIIQDDLDLPVGSIRLKTNSGNGGHNGIKNIEEELKTNSIKRLKIGIDKNKNYDTVDYVLGKFSKEDMEKLDSLKEIVNDIIDRFPKEPFDSIMNQYNKRG